jgi:hypothetical protein
MRQLIGANPQASRPFALRVVDLPLAAAMLGVKEMAQDREEPGPDVAAFLELLGTGPSPQECLLHEIVCPNTVMRQRRREVRAEPPEEAC